MTKRKSRRKTGTATIRHKGGDSNTTNNAHDKQPVANITNDTTDGDTTTMKGDTMNGEMPRRWSWIGTPMTTSSPFLITFLLYLCTYVYPGGEKLALVYKSILFVS
jgi:hypothetical protein